MKKIKFFSIITIMGIILLLSIKNVKAFEVKDNQTVDSKKVWTIKFTDDVGYDEIIRQGIIVTDSKGNKADVNINLGNDSKTVIVNPPRRGYVSGEKYTLTVGRQCHNKKGKIMKQDREIHFNVENLNINYKVTVEESTIMNGTQQITVLLDDDIDSSKYDVFLDYKKLTYENGSFNTIGMGYFQGTIRQHIFIKPKVEDKPKIMKINDLDLTIKKNDKYELPTTVKADMRDGSVQDVKIIWNKQIDTSKTGVFIFYGLVEGYNDNSNPVVLSITIE